MLLAHRADLEGVEEQFVDNMARGLDAWTSAAGRDLIRWGFMVLQKSVSMPDVGMCSFRQGFPCLAGRHKNGDTIV